MSFHYDVGNLGPNQAVQVQLDRQANVLLLDDLNLSKYQRGERCTYYGGRAIRSPIRLRPPRRAHWHVVIDGVSRVRASVSTLG